jgi:acyl carrier protein
VGEKDSIREFIRRDILFGEEDISLDDDSPLLEGVLDSMALMRLVAFIEEEFDIEVDDQEISTQNFRTIEDVARLVKRTAEG